MRKVQQLREPARMFNAASLASADVASRARYPRGSRAGQKRNILLFFSIHHTHSTIEKKFTLFSVIIITSPETI